MSDELGLGFSDEDIVAMVTADPGDMLARAWPRQVGRLEPESVADLVVIDGGGHHSVWTSLVRATEPDVELVVIDGNARNGTPNLMKQAGATLATPITVGNHARQLSLSHPTAPEQAWTWGGVLAALEAVRADPKHAITSAQSRAFASTARSTAPDAPLRLALDMPTGIAPVGGLPKDLGTITIPPLDSLTHDAAYFTAVHGGGSTTVC